MLVRMITNYASPRGNAAPGKVIDLPEEEARELIARKYATAANLSLPTRRATAPPAETPPVAAEPAEQEAETVPVRLRKRK